MVEAVSLPATPVGLVAPVRLTVPLNEKGSDSCKDPPIDSVVADEMKSDLMETVEFSLTVNGEELLTVAVSIDIDGNAVDGDQLVLLVQSPEPGAVHVKFVQRPTWDEDRQIKRVPSPIAEHR